MSFRKLRGVHLPERKQGLIRYTCLNFGEQPRWIQQKIRRLCEDCGGAYASALFELMTTSASVTAVSLRHHISESELYRMRKAFYESWGSGKK